MKFFKRITNFTWILLILVMKATSSDITSVKNVMFRARCQVSCWSELHRRTLADPDVSDDLNPVDFISCTMDANCKSCLQPCSPPFVNLKTCEELCVTIREIEKKESCKVSCRKLSSFRESNWFQFFYKRGPSPPRDVQLEVTNDNIIIKWEKSINPTSKPLSYVIFSKYVISPLHKPIHKSDYSVWMTAPSSITHSQQISFPAKPGRFYKFYIKAVSEDGASEASYANEGQAVRLIREPSSPGNVKDLKMAGKLTEEGKNTIILKWKEPIDSDLPIDSYKIKYQKLKKRRKNRQRDWMMDDAGLRSATSEKKRRKRRHEARVSHSGDKEQKYTLKNLSAGSFEISVSAIAKYGQSSLESKPNTIVVDLPQTSLGSFRHKDRRNNLPKVTGLTHRRPLYDKKDGLIFNITWQEPKIRRKLKTYKVKWTFKGCLKTATTKISGHVLRKKTYHVFKNLPFQCNINVEVSYETKSKKSTFYSLPANYEFSTGSCMDVKMVYLLKDSPDACSDNNSSKTEKAVPEDLRISNVVKLRNRKQKTIILKIQWKPPSNIKIDPYRYRVSWNPVSKSDEEEKSSAEYRVVKAKDGLNTVTIENSVRQKTNYRVSVESIFKVDGRWVFSRPVIRQQKTPNLGFGSSDFHPNKRKNRKRKKNKNNNRSHQKHRPNFTVNETIARSENSVILQSNRVLKDSSNKLHFQVNVLLLTIVLFIVVR